MQKKQSLIIWLVAALLFVGIGAIYYFFVHDFNLTAPKTIERTPGITKKLDGDDGDDDKDSHDPEDPLTKDVSDYNQKNKYEKGTKAKNISDKKTYPKKILISQEVLTSDGRFNFQARTSDINDKQAVCILTLNGKERAQTKVTVYPDYIICRGFVIPDIYIKQGKNLYEVCIKTEEYEDCIKKSFDNDK